MKTWENEKDLKVDPKVDALCIEHRKKLGIYSPTYTNSIGSHDRYWGACQNHLKCYDKCPVSAERDKIYPKEVKGMPVNIKKLQEGYEKGAKEDLEIAEDWHEFGNLEEKSSKKEKKISRETEDFLWMQSRVIDKLNRHPELWRIMDRMFADDIVQKLCGKSVGELVPAHYGGKMDTKVSKSTKKMFENLEKQFAEEDEKTGKKAPDYEKNDPPRWDSINIGSFEPHGYFEKGVWHEKKEEKKNDEQKKAD